MKQKTKKWNIKNALFIRPRDKLVPWFSCRSKLDILYIQLPFYFLMDPKELWLKLNFHVGCLVWSCIFDKCLSWIKSDTWKVLSRIWISSEQSLTMKALWLQRCFAVRILSKTHLDNALQVILTEILELQRLKFCQSFVTLDDIFRIFWLVFTLIYLRNSFGKLFELR